MCLRSQQTPDSMGEKRVPKRSSSMTHVLPGAPGYQRYPRAKSTGLIFGDNPSGILESPADEVIFDALI